MTPEQEKVKRAIKESLILMPSVVDSLVSEIDAIYNSPPAPTRDHNSLAVTENTPERTIIITWNNPGFPVLAEFRGIDSCGRIQVYSYFGKDDWTYMSNAERYIGQHFIPWDAEQSDDPPCDGRVTTRYFDGANDTTVYKESPDWSQITGYLPVTKTGEVDWERVPR